MGALHPHVTPALSFTGDLIPYTAGIFLTVLLLVLTLRASRLPGAQPGNVAFALCALLWSAGGLLALILRGSGFESSHRSMLAARAIQYSGALVFPIPVLAVWRRMAARAHRERPMRLLQTAAWLSASLFGLAVWAAPLRGAVLLEPDAARILTALNAALLLAAGAWFGLSRASTPRPVYLPSLAIVAAACATAAMLSIDLVRPDAIPGHGFRFAFSHLVMLVVLCSFFLFARFRFADLFVRYGIRILLAGTWASILVMAAQSTLIGYIADHAAFPQVVHIFCLVLLANLLLLSFTLVDERLGTLVNRWLFRAPDYAAARRELASRLADVSAETAVFDALAKAARDTLDLESARVVTVDASMPSGIHEGDVVQSRDMEVAAPIASDGRVTHALLALPGPARPGLVMQDLNYLRTVSVLGGNRLDAIRREREAAERQSREALLERQVTEAELRALRAQINPHFLFNALNTVADQIVRNPARAEAMTLRLASVFRHILAQASRPLTTIREEVEFLRTCLHIEEARFGDRLQVSFNVEPEVEPEALPSLILQPLVENALKHGLGPKPGPVRLWITARAEGAQVVLTVEDDGVGPGPAAPDAPEPAGMGLANVAERLATLYQNRAGVKLEPRPGGGCRVTVWIPRAGS